MHNARQRFINETDADSDMRALIECEAARGEIAQNGNTHGAELLFGKAGEIGGGNDERHVSSPCAWARDHRGLHAQTRSSAYRHDRTGSKRMWRSASVSVPRIAGMGLRYVQANRCKDANQKAVVAANKDEDEFQSAPLPGPPPSERSAILGFS